MQAEEWAFNILLFTEEVTVTTIFDQKSEGRIIVNDLLYFEDSVSSVENRLLRGNWVVREEAAVVSFKLCSFGVGVSSEIYEWLDFLFTCFKGRADIF